MIFSFKTDANGDPVDILTSGYEMDLFCGCTIPIEHFLTFHNTVTLVLSQVDFPPNCKFTGELSFETEGDFSSVYIESVENATSYIENGVIMAPKNKNNE
jgi:hypothetical protein